MGNFMIGNTYPPSLGGISKIFCGTEQCWPIMFNKISINFIWRSLSHEVIKMESDTIDIDSSVSGDTFYTSQTLSSTGITITVRTDNLSQRGIISSTRSWRKFNWNFTPGLSGVQVQNTGALFIPFTALNALNETFVYSIELMEMPVEHALWIFFHNGTVMSKIVDAWYIPISKIGITGQETIGELSSVRPLFTLNGTLYARCYVLRESATEYEIQFEERRSGKWEMGGYGYIVYENNKLRWRQSLGLDVTYN